MDLADEFVKIPMVGFTESLNISVTAAILHPSPYRQAPNRYLHSLATYPR